MQEVNIGQYSIPAVLMVVLAIIYSISGAIPDRWKPLIAVAAGIGLGVLGLLYAGAALTVRSVMDYLLYGFMTGAAAVGLYEVNRALRRPRQ